MPELLPPETSCWVLSDRKAGDELQCLAIADGLSLTPLIKHVHPRPPWVWAMPWGPIDPRDAASRPGSPLAPPFPDIAIASGRRAVPYLRALKRASQGATFTFFLKDPRTGCGAADLIWVPLHDRLRGANVIVTLTSPHRLTPERLNATPLPAAIAALARPRVALLIGGDSRHHRFTPADIETLTGSIALLARSGVSLMATTSRRTPAALRLAIREVVLRNAGFFWDGSGDNPYAALLAGGDAAVVTADSVNMLGEAAATGRPVLIYEPAWARRPNARLQRFVAALTDSGVARPFHGRLETYVYKPLDATPVISAALAAAYRRHLAALGPRGRQILS